MSKPIKDNIDVFQSYIFTMSKYDMTVYERRIMYRLVEMAQKDLKGLLIKDNLRKLEPTTIGMNVQMPIRDILRHDEQDKNYAKAKNAFKKLADRFLEYEDERTWFMTAIIEHPKIDKFTGIATFHVYDPVWRCIVNFSKGYRRYELATIMNFKSIYSMRFYELMSGQNKPMKFTNGTKITFDDLCDRFKLSKRMRQPPIFEAKVLNTAKEELDKYAPYSFDWERETVPSRGRNGEKVIGYTFKPYYLQKNRDPELEKIELAAKLPAGGHFGILKKEIYDYLQHNMDWSEDSIKRNKKTLMAGQEIIPDFIYFLSYVNGNSRNANNRIGYVINAIKTKCKELALK